MELLRRHACDHVERLMTTFPLVAVTGARQVGKSTLARIVLEDLGGTYVSLDDPLALTRAAEDPVGFVRHRDGLLVIDEIQLAPGLLPIIKSEIDRDRRPGRFLITGSANLLRMRSVTESLAGRSAWHELAPPTWSEILGKARPEVVDRAFSSGSANEFMTGLREPIEGQAELARERALRGGMPEPLGLSGPNRRAWYDAYRTTFIERDLRQLARIENLPDFRRLTSLALLRSGNLLNRSAMGSEAGLKHDTTKRYLDILEVAYQVFELSPFFANMSKRLVKSPKLFATDVGMVSHIANIDTWDEAITAGKDGALLETWVVDELMTLDRMAERTSNIHFWRTSAGAEVDLVFERGTDVVAVEVKSSATLRWQDTSGLRSLRESLGERFRMGLLAYLGDEPQELDGSLCAVPIATLLGATK